MPEMLIGGEWRQAAAHEELEVVNPATEETVDSVPAGGPEDIELAVETAKRAFRRSLEDEIVWRSGRANLAEATTTSSKPKQRF